MNSKPTFQLVRLNNTPSYESSMHGGFSYGNSVMNPVTNPIEDIADQELIMDDGERMNLYKAKKYHYKCQSKINEMMAGGQQCPMGFEKYLQPFQ